MTSGRRLAVGKDRMWGGGNSTCRAEEQGKKDRARWGTYF